MRFMIGTLMFFGGLMFSLTGLGAILGIPLMIFGLIMACWSIIAGFFGLFSGKTKP